MMPPVIFIGQAFPPRACFDNASNFGQAWRFFVLIQAWLPNPTIGMWHSLNPLLQPSLFPTHRNSGRFAWQRLS